MIFSLLGNTEYKSPFVYSKGIYTLITSYELALKKYPELDYFDNKISDKVYWADNLNDFIKNFLSNKFKNYEIKPSVTEEIEFDFVIEANNEMLCLKDKTIYTLDKRIALYFNEEVNFVSQKMEFSLLLKQIGVLDYTYEDIIQKLKEYFGDSHKYYIPMLYSILKEQTVLYDKKLFEDILFLKAHLECEKIYNVKSEFNLKRDNKGRYFQCNYTESLTGRIFPRSQSLQTLPKNQRWILEAEENCYLIEYDFSAFEFNILLDVLGIKRVEDPHIDILKYLNIKAHRDVGKSINYSFLYGMTAEKLAYVIKTEHNIDIDVELLKNYPLYKQKIEVPIKDGIITTYFGRPVKIEKEYAAFHNYIQSTAVDIFTKKVSKVIKILPNDELNKLILQNHDSVLIQLHNDVINNTDLVNEILQIFKEPIDIFTFEISVKYGKKWSELK